MGEAAEVEAHQLPQSLLGDDDALWGEVAVHHLDVSVEEIERLRQLQEAILDLDRVELVFLGGREGGEVREEGGREGGREGGGEEGGEGR